MGQQKFQTLPFKYENVKENKKPKKYREKYQHKCTFNIHIYILVICILYIHEPNLIEIQILCLC